MSAMAPMARARLYAPALANSLKTIGYAEFYGIVVGGKQDLGAGKEKSCRPLPTIRT